MKRFFICAFTIIMSLLTALMGGCSCSGCIEKFPLVFENYFIGGGTNDATPGYYEKLTYTVKNENSYNDALVKDKSITDKVAKYEYEGIYVTEFTVESSLPAGVETNLDVEGKSFYHLKTDLMLTSTYTVSGTYAEGYLNQTTENGDVQYEEYVKSEIWFLQRGQSFAPVYSTIEQKNTFLSIAESEANVNLSESTVKTTYNKSRFKFEKVINGKASTESHGYDYKMAIDNNQLLFALRNVEINKGGSFSLPTISPSYKSAQTLIAKNEYEDTKAFNVNGEQVSVATKNISFNRNDTFNKGPAHYVVVQKSQSANLPYKSYMMQYASPLIAYGSFTSMGALVYTLTNVAN